MHETRPREDVAPIVGRHAMIGPSPDYCLRVDDAELVERLRAGDQSAFTELVRRYHTTLVRLARYYVGSEASAEDVAQDTWIAVLRGVDRFEGRSSFKTWLLRICVNRARTTGVRESRTVSVAVGDAGPSVAAQRFDEAGLWRDPPVPFTDDVELRLDHESLVAMVRTAIHELGEPQQTVVTLRDGQGLSTQEVAQLTGLSEGNVRVVLHRGRAKVREAVETAMREAKT
jgi:RNA polymerase sigma-70 factor (ECF subfamily)